MNKKKGFFAGLFGGSPMAAATWRLQRKSPKRKRAVVLWRSSRNRMIAIVTRPQKKV